MQEFIEWRDSYTTDILYVDGDIDMEETSEQLFYVLDQRRIRGSGDGQVLYFSFEKYDKTRNTLKDMLATFIAQMICHNAHDMSFAGQSMFVQLSEEGGWTDQDLLQWFSQCSSYVFADYAYIVIHGFDECSETGRMAFMDWLDQTTTASETLWKVAITSRQRLELTHEKRLVECSRQVSMGGFQHNSSLSSNHSKELKSLIRRHRPESSLNDDELLRSIDSIAGGDTLIQEVLLANFLSLSERPIVKYLQDNFGPMAHQSSSEKILAFILDNILRKLPPAWNVRTLLLWLVHSARPLSVWELAFVTTYPDYLDSPNVSPRPDIVRKFTQMCETRLRGIVEIRDTQVRLRHPRLREILVKPTEASDMYIWSGINASEANHKIAQTCLRFIARDDIQRELKAMAEDTTLSETSYGPSLRHTNFCAYATYYWPRHAASLQDSSTAAALLEQYKQSALTATWIKSFWCLSKPVTRKGQPSDSLDAMLASLRLPHARIDTWDLQSINFAAREAAAGGNSSSLKELLFRCEQSESALIDVLKAAASSGKERLALYVFKHIRDVAFHNEALVWPPCLLYRAAWMGMDQFAGELLDTGCSADPGGPMAEMPRLSPLHLAVRHAHTNTIVRLLSHGADTGFLTRWNRNILFTATYSGRPEEVFQILFERARLDLADTDDFKDTPLHYAAFCGRKAAVKSLLRMGADPHDGKDLAASDIEWLPLIKAASKGRTESVRILLDHDADPNQPGPQRVNTALYYTAVNNFPHTLRVLLERGADPNHPLLNDPILVVLASSSDIPVAAKNKMVDIMNEFKAKIDAADGQGRTALMHAIQAGDESVIIHLLTLGANVNVEDNEKRSPLHLAAGYGSEAILKLILSKGPEIDRLGQLGTALKWSVTSANKAAILLEHGANPDLMEKEYGASAPLMWAAQLGYVETVKVLLKHHAQVNLKTDSKDGRGYTAVYKAASNNHTEIVKILADAGADLKCKSPSDWTALHVAPAEAASVLLRYRKRINIDEKGYWGWTALHYAIHFGEIEMVKLLVNSGADLNVVDDAGDTPLATATWRGNHEALNVLLQEEDCDPRIPLGSYKSRGRPPLHWVVMKFETIDIVRLLVERGADVNLSANARGSPLQQACRNKHKGKEMVDYLLERGANLNAQGGALGFAISSAAIHTTPDMIRMLLQRGATVNVTDAMGRNPIHMACVGGIDNFRAIYEAGGNQHLEAEDNMGRTLFHYAAQHAWPEILEMLIAELGTDLLDKPDVDGWTPLMWACLPRFPLYDYYGLQLRSKRPKLRQPRVFQILLEQGAKPSTVGKLGEASWSLQDIMVYNDIDEECRQLVDKALMSDGSPVPSATTDASQICEIGDLPDEGKRQCDACYCVSTPLTIMRTKCYSYLAIQVPFKFKS